MYFRAYIKNLSFPFPRSVSLSHLNLQSCFGVALCSLLLLTSCQRPPDESQGVELVLSSPEPTPDMTFELRFDEIMARPNDIGVVISNSPLVIAPSIAGTFTWLSLRSGVFTPSQPLAMDTRYEITLRPRLELPNGQPANVKLRQTLKTPPFSLI